MIITLEAKKKSYPRYKYFRRFKKYVIPKGRGDVNHYTYIRFIMEVINLIEYVTERETTPTIYVYI